MRKSPTIIRLEKNTSRNHLDPKKNMIMHSVISPISNSKLYATLHRNLKLTTKENLAIPYLTLNQTMMRMIILPEKLIIGNVSNKQKREEHPKSLRLAILKDCKGVLRNQKSTLMNGFCLFWNLNP